MEVLSGNYPQFLFPRGLVKAHYYQKVPREFERSLIHDPLDANPGRMLVNPSLYTARLSEILNWLHQSSDPRILQEKPCITPLLLYEGELSFARILLHYEGNPQSARLIRRFIEMFELTLSRSCATIISPSFIPKSRMKEEQELIQMVTKATAETSFIKFNFNRIGDFWSYAVKHECTLLVTTKNYQSDLSKILFHFYKGGMWYNQLSFYLA